MAGRRKSPKLRLKDDCFVANIYKPNGMRTTISFGSVGQLTEGDIYAAFGKWLNLYSRCPHKALSFNNPYDAIDNIVDSSTIVTTGELFDKYLEVIGKNSLPSRDGKSNPGLARIRQLARFLEPYHQWPVADFGPDELKAVQDAMVAYRYVRGKDEEKSVAYTRTGINRVINHIHHMWRWGVGREITTEAQCQRLKEVKPLRVGKSTAKDRLKRAMVTPEEFNEVAQYLTSVVADMLRIIWFTAMRPGEVCRMRAFDIVRDDSECWLYIPGRDTSSVGDHKTAHFQRIRAIPLTAKVQEILLPRVTDFESTDYVFSPAEAIQEMRERRFATRKTPMSQGNSAGTNRRDHPMITPGNHYTPKSLNVAVKRACKRAAVERLTPYDLRRSAATRVRAQLSKEDAKLLLGHVSTDTTEIYLLDEVQEAIRMAKKLEINEI